MTRAFTLIELLVVIAVIGLLSSIVLVNLRGTREDARIAVAEQFAASVHHGIGIDAVGIWDFTGNANDSSGYGNDGTVNGATLTADRNGNANSAYDFDGTDDWIDIGAKPIPSSGDFTVVGWFYLETDGSRGGVFQRQEASPFNGTSLGKGSSGNIVFSVVDSAGTNLNVLVPQALETWKHYAGVYNASEKKVELYVDGARVGTNSDPAFTGELQEATQNTLRIGRRSTTYWNGKIDDVRVYSRVLTTAEVRQLYAAGRFRQAWGNGKIVVP